MNVSSNSLDYNLCYSRRLKGIMNAKKTISSRKPTPTFLVRLHGKDVFPEKVPVRALADVVSAIQSLANGPVHSRDEEFSIRLLDITRGSAKYACIAEKPESAIANLRKTGTVVATPESGGIEYFMLQPLRKLSRIAARLDCRIAITQAATGFSVELDANSYLAVRGHSIVRDEARVTGELIRVGGATEKRCSIRLPGRDSLLYCKLADGVSSKLGSKLYSQVTLIGRGTYFSSTWELLTMTVNDVVYPSTSSFEKFYNEIRQVSGFAWDNVENIQGELESMR